MLQHLSEEIRACLQHARDCANQAEAQRSLELRQEFLAIGQRWLKLARSYEFVERLVLLGCANPTAPASTTTTKSGGHRAGLVRGREPAARH
jgi:hypothetical protein